MVIFGASNKINRYSYKVILFLKRKNNYKIIPVHPDLSYIEGIPVVTTLDDIHESVDILSIYVKPEILEKHLAHIVDLKPRMIILNPGTESSVAEMYFEKHCIIYHKACTLVLLKTGVL